MRRVLWCCLAIPIGVAPGQSTLAADIPVFVASDAGGKVLFRQEFQPVNRPARDG